MGKFWLILFLCILVNLYFWFDLPRHGRKRGHSARHRRKQKIFGFDLTSHGTAAREVILHGTASSRRWFYWNVLYSGIYLLTFSFYLTSHGMAAREGTLNVSRNLQCKADELHRATWNITQINCIAQPIRSRSTARKPNAFSNRQIFLKCRYFLSWPHTALPQVR